MAKLRLMIVDDHKMFRNCLRMLLEREPDLTVIGEAGDADQAVAKALTEVPDVILMDLHLPHGGTGIDATRQILAIRPDIKVIAVTMHQQDEKIAEMMQAGAHGYILKEADADELLRAIRSVAAGGVYISPGAVPAFLAQYRRLASQSAEPSLSGLAEREVEMLRLAAAGKTNREIAAALSLSRHTLNRLLSETYSKLGVANRTEAVALALSRGLIRRTP